MGKFIEHGVKTDLQPSMDKDVLACLQGLGICQEQEEANCTRSEGCIAERYIAEEAVEFCTEHLSDVSTVGVPSSQKMGVAKPLSGCIGTYDPHQDHLSKFRKRIKWLQDKHNSTFIQWFHFKVQSELNGEEHNGISENLRLASNWSKHGSAII
ncbi:hypothetical protein Prudu_628S000200 [Prunus dulcis]|uniref:DUF4218 domain-containing protein n=1 Tax=Prunus dulcis TaxID=3755 RepID=A0A5H2XL95_PRUDU|nr:hypothetical protein Prudu_628S000200 [Prunus dulcis]